MSHVGILIKGSEKARETERFYSENFGMREIMRGDPNQEGMNLVYLEDFTGTNPFWLEVVGDVLDEDRYFIGVVRGEREIISTAQDGRNALEVVLAAQQSYREDKPIRL